METFGLTGKKVYITGESYAGRYVPYIADAMLKEHRTDYYDVKAIMIYDPSVAEDSLLEDVPAVAYVDEWAGEWSPSEPPYAATDVTQASSTSTRVSWTKFTSAMISVATLPTWRSISPSRLLGLFLRLPRMPLCRAARSGTTSLRPFF